MAHRGEIAEYLMRERPAGVVGSPESACDSTLSTFDERAGML
jgi:hypothetical protein